MGGSFLFCALIEIEKFVDGNVEGVSKSVERAHAQVFFASFNALVISVTEAMVSHVFLSKAILQS